MEIVILRTHTKAAGCVCQAEVFPLTASALVYTPSDDTTLYTFPITDNGNATAHHTVLTHIQIKPPTQRACLPSANGSTAQFKILLV